MKTSSTQSFQWTAKDLWDPLPGFDPDDRTDFVVLVAFKGNGPRGADIYVVPASVVLDAINKVHRTWHDFPKRDGTARKWTKQRCLRLNGRDRPGSHGYDFARKWAEYRDAWDLLEDR